MQALIKGGVHIPLAHKAAKKLKEKLSLKYWSMGESDKEPRIVEAFYLTDSAIVVPRQFGLAFCDKHSIEVVDCTSAGQEILPPRNVEPRAAQAGFIGQLVATAQDRYDFIAKAHTGFGKTISSLIAAFRLGRAVLVVVDQENLLDQWRSVLVNPDLFGIPPDQVGIVQGSKDTHEGATVTIGMMQTLVSRDMGEDFYDYFGTAIVDEVHIAGAPTFSSVLLRINAAYRWGVSATPRRKDGLQKLLDYNLGEVAVVAEQKHDKSAVYFTYHPTVYSWYGNVSPKVGRILTEISEDGSRLMASAEAVHWLYEENRQILVISDRIEQLKNLRDLLYYMGVPMDVMGLYTGYDPSYGFAKEARPPRRPNWAERGAEYTPVSLQSISKRIPKRVLEDILASKQIILATYQKFSKGVDVPRLDAGVDITPRSSAEQTHGRILRKVKGKKTPIWITTADWNSYRSMHMWANRITEYGKSNADIYEWLPEGGLRKWDANTLQQTVLDRVRLLQSSRIQTNKDGLDIVVTKEQQRRTAAQGVLDTVRRIKHNKGSRRDY